MGDQTVAEVRNNIPDCRRGDRKDPTWGNVLVRTANGGRYRYYKQLLFVRSQVVLYARANKAKNEKREGSAVTGPTKISGAAAPGRRTRREPRRQRPDSEDIQMLFGNVN